MITMTIGQWLRAVRVECGVTQNELAERMGTVQPMISRLESSNSNPTYDVILRWVTALDRRLILGTA